MWKLPQLETRITITGAFDTDITAVFQDSGKKAIPPQGHYGAWVEKLRKIEAFDARHGSIQFFRFAAQGLAENVLFIGLGSLAEATEEKFRSAGGHLWGRLVAEKSKATVVHVESFFDVKNPKPESVRAKLIRAFAEGLILSAYQFKKYKSKAESSASANAKKEESLGPSRITFVTQDKNLKTLLETELSEVQAIGDAVRITRDWSNEPSNFGTPTYFAGEARKLAREYGLKCKVLTEQDAAREKMGLYLGVGQGSEREGRIVVLEYTPKNVKKPKTVALVGKGITFDSGGISIKPALRMEEMKHDMTGAATVLGAILLASKWKIRNRVVAVMAFTENMPSGTAIQPGNVLTARNGKTVEVFNTDAEGRLILGDALDYAQDFKPDAVVDIATLTGAVSIALGKLCCGILGNDDTLIDSMRRAGDANGERMWQLPLFDEYFEDLKSDCADMKNSANDSNGGTIRAAIFLKQFIRKGTPWVHLDIAATGYNVSHLSYFPKKGASGAYVRTLAKFVADF